MNPLRAFRSIPNRTIRLAALAAIAAVALAVAGSGWSTTSGGAKAAAGPKRGGVLKVGRVADAISLDPVFVTDNMSIWAKLLVFQLLVRTSPDGKNVVPDLADRWSQSQDGKTWTFHIRKGAGFSDGAPVTSADVKFTFERVINSKGSWAASLFPKMTIAAPNRSTVVFKLKEAWAPFLADLSVHAAAIVEKKYFARVGAKTFGGKPMGSGPFYVAKWLKGNEMVLKRNPHFWDKKRRPYLDEVDLLVLPDDNTRMLKVQSGEIDVGEDVPFNQIDKLKNTSGLKMLVQPYDRIDWIQFNEKNPKFKSVKVRQAINVAVDRQAIIKTVLFGYGQVPTTFLPKMSYADTKNTPYAYNVAKAKQLMAQSPYPKGFSTTVTVVSGDTIGAAVASIVKAELKQIGIEMQIHQLEGATQYSDLALGKYEMAEGYMTSDIIDPSELIAYAGAGDQGSYCVWTWYNNKEVNKLAAQGLRQLNPAKRAVVYTKMQRQVFHDAPYLWLYWSPARSAVRSNVNGYSKLPTGNYWLENVWKS
jgi:peptide/nickel transport system substrate-binding protein